MVQGTADSRLPKCKFKQFLDNILNHRLKKAGEHEYISR